MARLNLLLVFLGIESKPTGLSFGFYCWTFCLKCLKKRIIGGGPCVDTERLYHVALHVGTATYNDPDPNCGGSLISDQWVLTAAHCWEHGPGWTNTAVLGTHPQRATSETMTITNKKVYVDQNQNQHDIMLLKLPKKTTITPVKLPDCNNPLKVGDTVQMAGYAATTAGPNNIQISDTSPKPLQCADFSVQNINMITFRGHQFSIRSPGKDTCPGDSGGGAIHNNRIYGVHSSSGTYVCTADAEEMDVCEYEEWISKTIKPKCSLFSCLG